MSGFSRIGSARGALVAAIASAGFWGAGGAGMVRGDATQVKNVFIIAMENHNWTQPAGDSTAPPQIFNNTNAPFINSIVKPSFNGGALVPQATLFGTASPINISTQTAFATQYHNVLSNAAGTAGHIHPSEPNYIWMEGGTNFGVASDNTPYGSGGTNQTTTAHLSTLLTAKGVSWKSYQEDIDTDAAGNVLAQSAWTSPINNRSGTYTTVNNPYNGSKQYDYAAKHNPMIFFSDTNGGNDATTANTARLNYAPLQQLATDLANNSAPRYSWISPNQFNDMHTALSGGYTSKFDGILYTGEAAKIKQGDDFLRQIVPVIMASQAYKDGGAIVIWNDETEGNSLEDDFNHTIMEIVISPLAHPNVSGIPYSNAINYTHSSDVRTLQEIFQAGSTYLNDAANATDLSDLFAAGAIPSGLNAVPEPASVGLLGLGAAALLARRRRR